MHIVSAVCFIGSLLIHTFIDNEFSLVNLQKEKLFSEKKQSLLNKNEYKLKKLCKVVGCNSKILSANIINHITIYKYHYDLISPIRRVIDCNRFIHFNHLSKGRKLYLILKYSFSGFYHSL